MKIDDEFFSTAVVAWLVIVTIILGILLPFTVNVAVLPALFYKGIAERSADTQVPDYVAGFDGAGNARGLLVDYTFEDEHYPKNHVFFDESGNHCNAIAHGILIRQGPGIVGNYSVSLPGTGYLYTYLDPAAGRTNVTFSLWFVVPDKTHNYRLAGSVPTGTRHSGWTIGTKSSELWDDEGDPVRVLTSTRLVGSVLFTDGWNHKAVVYNTTHVTEYLNGVVITRYSASGKPLGAGKAMTIGSWEPFGMNYAGQVDEFQIYDRALNATEIDTLYRQGA